MVGKAHCETLKGRVGLTVTKIRSQFWIPNLQQMPDKIFARYYGCKKFGSAIFWRQLLESYPKTKQKVIDHSKWLELNSLEKSHKRSRKRTKTELIFFFSVTAYLDHHTKEAVWLRGKHIYLTGLRERQKVIYGKEQKFKVGDVVKIKRMKPVKAYRNSE